MKKIALFLSACSILAACSKESQIKEMENSYTNTKKSGSYSEIEVYTNPEDIEDVLSGFLTTVSQSGDQDDKSLAEGIWLIEGATNYKYRHAYGAYDSYEYADPIILIVDLINDGEEMLGSSVKSAFNNLDDEIAAYVGDGIDLHVADVSVDSLWSDGMSLRVQPVYGVGALTLVPSIDFEASNDREQALTEYCNNTTPLPPNTGFDYAELLTTRKFVANTSYQAGYIYSVNVTAYGFLTNNPLYWDDLYAQQNDARTHSQTGSSWDCVTVADLNHYRDVIYNNIQGLKNSNQEFISCNIYISGYSSIPGTYWYYDRVELGEHFYSNQAPGY